MSDHPWLSSALVIDRAVLDDIDAHAVAEYPNECCGFLIGPEEEAARVDQALRAVNLADKYHKLDPETFPRTAREYYTIDARVIQRTFEQGAKARRPVKLIYHSHCDCGAYFSQTDQEAAAPDGQLAYPVAFLVTSVVDRKVVDRKVFSLRQGQWVELPFSVRS